MKFFEIIEQQGRDDDEPLCLDCHNPFIDWIGLPK